MKAISSCFDSFRLDPSVSDPCLKPRAHLSLAPRRATQQIRVRSTTRTRLLIGFVNSSASIGVDYRRIGLCRLRIGEMRRVN
uniref:Uncharacterized protein n=1 Tax=Kalanchoe fedtschenkoi TaxID=63787 RepID=A0A7N0U9R4_KALFE